MNLRSAMAGVAVAAAACVAPMAAHAELVSNGGFETGDFTGWTLGGNTGFTGVTTSPVASGAYAAFFGAVGSNTTLSQTLATVAGQTYTLSFDLRNDGGSPNLFQALLGGDTLTTLTNAGAQPFTHYAFDWVAGSNSSALQFNFRQDPAFWELDNVSVNLSGAVPEPATWAMLIAGFGLMGVAMRRRRALATA